MRKALLAAFTGAGVFAVPAFAQLSAGDPAHVDVGVSGPSNALRAPGPLAPVAPGLPQTRHHVRHTVDLAKGKARSALGRHGKAHAGTTARGSAHAHAGDATVQAKADVDADQATARGAGDQVSGTARSVANRGSPTMRSVADEVHPTATESPVGATPRCAAGAGAHGH